MFECSNDFQYSATSWWTINGKHPPSAPLPIWRPNITHNLTLLWQVVWCWILGACVCFTLGASIAEIVSAYPTCGGLWVLCSGSISALSLTTRSRYTASAHLTPKRYRAEVKLANSLHQIKKAYVWVGWLASRVAQYPWWTAIHCFTWWWETLSDIITKVKLRVAPPQNSDLRIWYGLPWASDKWVTFQSWCLFC
jgi:hypothetical protein